MYEKSDEESRAEPPSLINTLTELPRTLVEISSLMVSLPALSVLPRGDGHPVMLLPGFMAGDESTGVLRRYLSLMGYRPSGWGLGRNTGRPKIIKKTLIDQFLKLSSKSEKKISLIGQSLGGVFGRELARLFPEKVRQVITLGSPFSMTDANATNVLVRKLFEIQSGKSIEEMRQLLGRQRNSQIPVTAIYSKDDGIVNWRGCVELQVDNRTENIEVCGSHCGMAFNAGVYYIIANRLAQPEGKWVKFDKGCLRQ